MSSDFLPGSSPSVGRAPGHLPLEAVIATDELRRRPARAPDHAAENAALAALLESLARGEGDWLAALAGRALELCRAHSAGVSLLEHEDGQPVVRCRAAAGRWSAHRGRTMPRGQSLSGLALDRGEPLLLAHPERHFPIGSAIDLPIAEVLLVPFEVEGRTAGTLWAIAHDDSRRFDAEDLRLLTSLARLAALSEQIGERDRLATQLATRRLIDDERTAELAGMRRLHDLSLRLIESGDAATLFQSVIDAACEIMCSDFASLQVYVPERGELRLIAYRGFEPACAASWEWISAGRPTICGLALHRKERVVAPDLETFPPLAGTPELADYRSTGIRAVQSTPLLTRSGQVIGMASTHWRRATQPSEDDLRLFDVLAGLAGQLLQRSLGEQALREADLRKTEFLALLAHELRNPLASLHNALQIVRLAASDPPATAAPPAAAVAEGCEVGEDQQTMQAATAIMDRQLAHLVRLVDDLLDISRISRGRIELRRERVDLAAVLHQAIETTGPMCKQLEQKVHVELPGQPLFVSGDASRLAQVFANLLNNACKYSERGRPIRLAARIERPADGADGAAGAAGEVVVTVRDEGIGIAHDQLSRIFEMFAQVDTSLERAQGGLGLGLTLVKSVVELHGGRVEAISDGPGHGSEFVVRLPLAALPADGHGPGAGGGPTFGARHRILVVDDNRDAADSLALLLRTAGHETQTAYGGAQALTAAESFRPNVILLDLGMPGLNGYETCKRLRALPWGRGVYVVAQTGWGHVEDRALSQEAGFHAHLVKPVALEDLAKLLKDLPARRD